MLTSVAKESRKYPRPLACNHKFTEPMTTSLKFPSLVQGE